MHPVKLCSNFIYLWCYPIYEAKKFHERVIRPNAIRKGKCSEPRVGIVLCVQLMTLFSLTYAHNPQPVVDLETGYNNYAIHFGQKTFQLVYSDTGIVMTHSEWIR